MKRVLFVIIGLAIIIAGGILLGVGIKKMAKTEVEEKVYDITEEFNNITVDVDTTGLYFKKSTDGNTKVVCTDLDKLHHEVSVIDGTLVVKSVDERHWYEMIFNYRSLKITVYLSNEAFSNLNIKSSTGDIEFSDEFTFDSVKIKLSTGDVDAKIKVNNEFEVEVSTGNIKLHEASAKSLKLKSSTGRINLENVDVTNDVDITSSTGKIILTNLRSENLRASASTGHVTLKDTIINGNIIIKTSTGDVKFDGSDGLEIHVSTTTGDVTGTILSSKIFFASSDTGKINVPHLTEGGKCEVETDTGDIILNVK